MPDPASFVSLLTGSFSTPASDNPTVAMVEAAQQNEHRENAQRPAKLPEEEPQVPERDQQPVRRSHAKDVALS